MNLPRLLDRLRRDGAHDLAGYLAQQRWFRSKARRILDLKLVDAVLLAEHPPTLLALLRCRYDHSDVDRASLTNDESETYLLPLLLPDNPDLRELSLAQAARAFTEGNNTDIIRLLTEGIREGRSWTGVTGSIRCRPSYLAAQRLASLPRDAKPLHQERLVDW